VNIGRNIDAVQTAGIQWIDLVETFWSARSWLSGREVLERLEDDSRAYTTVMTVLGRLVEKGLVERVAEGKGRVYRAGAPAVSCFGRRASRLARGPAGKARAHLVRDHVGSSCQAGTQAMAQHLATLASDGVRVVPGLGRSSPAVEEPLRPHGAGATLAHAATPAVCSATTDTASPTSSAMRGSVTW
jgi:hypothetical protein